ncbi:MAG TPA: ubiquitin-like small modifier protein 1 [Anaerolineales bacterium]
MKVTFYATLRQVVGGKSVDFSLPENATVGKLLEEMIRCYPPLQRELLNEQGELYPHVHFFINGRDAPYLENGLDTPLHPEDIITVFPAVGGGSMRDGPRYA